LDVELATKDKDTKNSGSTTSGKSESATTRERAPSHSSEWDYPIIEVNPNCWLEKRAQFAAAGRKHGLSYPDLLERIIELALAQRPSATT
jgi:hypothetical protein